MNTNLEQDQVIKTTSHYEVRKSSNLDEVVSKGKLTWEKAYDLIDKLCDINTEGHSEYEDYIVVEVKTQVIINKVF